MKDLFSALLKCLEAFGKDEWIAELKAAASVKEHNRFPAAASASLGRASTWQGVLPAKAGSWRSQENGSQMKGK